MNIKYFCLLLQPYSKHKKMVSEIFNFYSYNEQLAAGGQPTEDQIKALKDNGYEAIVSISTSSTRNYLPTEPQVTEQLDLEYVHYPIDSRI